MRKKNTFKNKKSKFWSFSPSAISKKMIVIWSASLLLAGTYSICSHAQNFTAKAVPTIKKVSTSKHVVAAPAEKQAEVPLKTAKAKEINKELLASNVTKNPAPETKKAEVKNSYLSPTSKADILKQAAQNMGKNDPFKGTNSGLDSGSSSDYRTASNNGAPPGFNNTGTKVDSFLPMPPALDGGSLPQLGLPGNGLTGNTVVYNPVELKGFIGNKVIIEVDNVIEPLALNENFRGVKVMAIDARNLTAKFKKDGKVINRKIILPDNKTQKIISRAL